MLLGAPPAAAQPVPVPEPAGAQAAPVAAPGPPQPDYGPVLANINANLESLGESQRQLGARVGGLEAHFASAPAQQPQQVVVYGGNPLLHRGAWTNVADNPAAYLVSNADLNVFTREVESYVRDGGCDARGQGELVRLNSLLAPLLAASHLHQDTAVREVFAAHRAAVHYLATVKENAALAQTTLDMTLGNAESPAHRANVALGRDAHHAASCSGKK